jgi:proline iminopeptidase
VKLVGVAIIMTLVAGLAGARQTLTITDGRVPVAGASLYTRAIGHGRPAIVLHGGPDFDHRYLLPDLDRFSDIFRLL